MVGNRKDIQLLETPNHTGMEKLDVKTIKMTSRQVFLGGLVFKELNQGSSVSYGWDIMSSQHRNVMMDDHLESEGFS